MFWLGFLFGDENRKLKELERSRKQRELEEEEKKVSFMIEDFEPVLTSVDLSNLVRNSQHSVKWEVIGTDNKKLTSRLNKRKKTK